MFDDLKQKVSQKFEAYFKKAPTYLKILIIAAACVVVFLLARSSFFGDGIAQLSKRVVPVHIPIIDAPEPELLLTFFFEVNTKDGWIRGMTDEKYASDAGIRLTFNTNLPCWYMIVGMDKNQFFTLPEPGRTKATYFKPGKDPHLISFKLNGMVGQEIYIAVISKQPFDFDPEIKNAMEDLKSKKPDARGPEDSYRLLLDKRFIQKPIYFNTISHKE